MKCGRFNINDDAELRELLKSADHLPPTPDCRQAVMAGIDRRPSRSRALWAYAFGLLPAAALVLVLLIMNKPEPPKSEIAMAPRLPRVSEPANSIVALHLKVKAESVKQTQQREFAEDNKAPNVPYRAAPRQNAHARIAESEERRAQNPGSKFSLTVASKKAHDLISKRQVSVIENKTSQSSCQASADKSEPKSIAVAKERPVAIVTATWPSSFNQNETSYEYSYVSHNNATGRVEECRVKRSGDSVEIYLESKPAVQEPPVKRSEKNETNNSDKIVFMFGAATNSNSSARSDSEC